MVYRYPTRSTLVSERGRQQADIDESSTAPRNQGIVGLLLVGPGSTGDTLRPCTAGRARVHMEDYRKLHPPVVATSYRMVTLSRLMRPHSACCLKYWSETDAVLRADILLP